MSLYNMVNGVNPATFTILPMLGRHPDEYPRFRDCFAQGGKIILFTRTGSCGTDPGPYEEENEIIRSMPGFIKTRDWEDDYTYAYWEFKVPEEWVETYNLIINGRINEVSDAYIDLMCKVYPKLEDKFRSIKS